VTENYHTQTKDLDLEAISTGNKLELQFSTGCRSEEFMGVRAVDSNSKQIIL
jgi:hypothetical protein